MPMTCYLNTESPGTVKLPFLRQWYWNAGRRNTRCCPWLQATSAFPTQEE
jgi:hypothetical protein